MRNEDEILGQLRTRRPFREIRTNTNSVSKLYEITRQYLDELEVEVENKRAEVSKLEERKSDLETQIARARTTLETLSKETSEQQAKKQQLALDVSALGESASRLQNEIASLQEQRYTPDLLKKIRNMEPRRGPQMWSDLIDRT